MKRFEHLSPSSIEDILLAIGGDWQTRMIAGGTDLLPLMKRDVVVPSRLVNLKTVPRLAGFDFDERRGLVIGTMVTLDSLARSPVVSQRYRVLREAIRSAASPQLRNMATIGGNLCQASRCWYYRGPFFCWLKGGPECHAEGGENRMHAIFGGGPCYSAHPSDPAPALVALGADLVIHSRDGGRKTVPIAEFYALPTEDRRRETMLGPGDMVVEVHVPVPAEGSRGTYLKAMAREAWAFSLASVAVHGEWDGPVARSVTVVLGGVAPIPWRTPQAESAVTGREVNEAVARDAAEAAVLGAEPLSDNGYKLPLVKALVERALLSAAQPGRRRGKGRDAT
jgi:xanthine dehydrogenase YagS FAD-binding subunit